MARRRSTRRTLWPAALVAVITIGAAAGLFFSLRTAAPPAAPPAAAPPQTQPPAPQPPAPAPEADVPSATVDAAVDRALLAFGTPSTRAASEESTVLNGRRWKWRSETVEVRLRPGLTTEEAATRLVKEVERVRGRIVARHPARLRIGVSVDGLTAVTRDVRLVAVHAAAMVAIIFDDAGGSLADLEEIIALGRPVTLAVLPGLRFSRDVAERARAAGLELFLHLPLEPEDATKKLGPGGIATSMSDVEIADTVRADLAAVPGAVGVNNHMGSKGTTDDRVMRAVLQVVKERGLIFVDSVTSGRSIAASLAQEMGIPTARRHVFLDSEDDPEAVRAQLRRLIAVARRRGSAIGIGHAQRLTPQVLREMLAEFDRQGIQLVPVSVLVK